MRRIILTSICIMIFLGGYFVRDHYYLRINKTILNLSGKVQGCGGCMHCGDNWLWKQIKTISYTDESGMFPLCSECFNNLNYDTVLWYHLKLFEEWKRVPTNEQLERLSLEISKEKKFTWYSTRYIREKFYKDEKLCNIGKWK